jgi:hypothetical protein
MSEVRHLRGNKKIPHISRSLPLGLKAGQAGRPRHTHSTTAGRRFWISEPSCGSKLTQ